MAAKKSKNAPQEWIKRSYYAVGTIGTDGEVEIDEDGDLDSSMESVVDAYLTRFGIGGELKNFTMAEKKTVLKFYGVSILKITTSTEVVK